MKVTLIGLENYLNPEHSVFEAAEFPEGINLEALKGAIYLRCQEFELLYSDPDFMIAAVKLWAMKHYWTFDKWVKLLAKEYDPLYNKDYYEDITDTHEGTSTASGNTSTNDSGNTSASSTNKHSEKAYNTGSGYNEIEKDEMSSSGSTRNNSTGTFGNRNDDSYENGRKYHGYGNIGITSAQELFLKEVDVARFNLYQQIADLFCNEFCLMVY